MKPLSEIGHSVHRLTSMIIAGHYVESLKAFKEEGSGCFPTLEKLLSDVATRCAFRERFTGFAATYGAIRLEPRWDLLAKYAREEIRSRLAAKPGRDLFEKLKRVRSAR